jgi:two-component system OmpR family response regulator
MSGPRILVVDDDSALRSTIVSGLRAAGYEVDEAADGDVAMRLCVREQFDVVVIDIFMPNMDGLEFIRTIRRHNAETSIVAMSGSYLHDDVNYLSTARRLGADSILGKPFRVGQLVQIIQGLSDRG